MYAQSHCKRLADERNQKSNHRKSYVRPPYFCVKTNEQIWQEFLSVSSVNSEGIEEARRIIPDWLLAAYLPLLHADQFQLLQED